ncbi:C40 family peptidase [Solirubrobacter soli]|uniref:C40 family peptidase n=1 Tax=Solirubrobacter soli TaxID=363832 RepID=UPI000418BC44|nr:NlpC/P60 family protein [Solirubrobacter soli]
MPRRWRWLVPLTALMACVLPRAGASAAPQAVPDLPTPPAEGLLARAAQAATAQAIVQRDEDRAAERRELDGVVAVALAQVGDAYAWGGTGPDAFDCSGLTAFAFARARVRLPHTSQGQAAMGRPVARDDIRPGDLVFFSTAGAGPSHVGIATGKRTVVSATNSGVMEHSTEDAYWGGHYVGARRLAMAGSP